MMFIVYLFVSRNGSSFQFIHFFVFFLWKMIFSPFDLLTYSFLRQILKFEILWPGDQKVKSNLRMPSHGLKCVVRSYFIVFGIHPYPFVWDHIHFFILSNLNVFHRSASNFKSTSPNLFLFMFIANLNLRLYLRWLESINTPAFRVQNT